MGPQIDDLVHWPGCDLLLGETDHLSADLGNALSVQRRNQKAPVVRMWTSGHPDNSHAETARCRASGTCDRDAHSAPRRRIVQHLLVEGCAHGDDELPRRLGQETQMWQLKERTVGCTAAQHCLERIAKEL